MLWALGLAVAVITGYILAWQWDLLPREVIRTGVIQATDGKTLKTRQFYRSTRQDLYKFPGAGRLKREVVWEVQLPSGRWVDCDGDDCIGPYLRSRR
ncbi:hypothetical protein [Hyphomicrobium sp.]|uniref:hypothetical protein n=1 Tax=Hyphomicrobium sp. TaxID=82 RepID=UPI002E2F35EA|nr:hypothetical protein [Hyphomicrobium sp.]HEX2843068.1 hypothetical protein [Hyphomicrobium sp.]